MNSLLNPDYDLVYLMVSTHLSWYDYPPTVATIRDMCNSAVDDSLTTNAVNHYLRKDTRYYLPHYEKVGVGLHIRCVLCSNPKEHKHSHLTQDFDSTNFCRCEV